MQVYMLPKIMLDLNIFVDDSCTNIYSLSSISETIVEHIFNFKLYRIFRRAQKSLPEKTFSVKMPFKNKVSGITKKCVVLKI